MKNVFYRILVTSLVYFSFKAMFNPGKTKSEPIVNSGIVAIPLEPINEPNRIKQQAKDSNDIKSAENLYEKYSSKQIDSIVSDLENKAFHDDTIELKNVQKALRETDVSNKAIAKYIGQINGKELRTPFIQLWRDKLTERRIFKAPIITTD